MKFPSLGLRLFILSFLSIALALFGTSLVLNARFFEYFEDRVYSELEQHLEQLTTNLQIDAQGAIQVVPLLDRRFEQPFGGLYWQVQESDGPVVVSRSLWGGTFDVPQDSTPGKQFHSTSSSPIGTTLLVSGWAILLGEGDAQRRAVLSVGIDDSEVAAAAAGFRKSLIGWLGLMFAGLLLAAWAQVRIGLAPLQLLRGRIENIRAGTDSRLTGQFPSEVKPLVDEVNELLDLHEASLATARTRAGDLAHGLKTPLTVMRVLAQDISAGGQPEKADEIEEQISSMHYFVERELARASTGISSKSPVLSGPVVARMIASIKKLPRGAELEWNTKIPDDLVTPFDEHDLSELVGNILDNARKLANSRVDISAGNDGQTSGWISIADDGPGIPADRLGSVLERGGRLDTTTHSTGLGLTISADITAQKGGKLEFLESKSGGLEVRISW